MKQMITTILAIVVMVSCGNKAMDSMDVLFSDDFDSVRPTWKAITLQNGRQDDYSVTDGILTLSGKGNLSGLYHTMPVSGHFIVDLEFESDKNVGLALIQSKAGQPDMGNYTLLCVDTEGEHVFVELRDRQNGKENVLDHTGKTRFNRRRRRRDERLNIGDDLYKHILSGEQYSVPFTQTNKKIRIFREDNADFFHYYYQVSKEHEGKSYVDWLELRPSPDWASENTEYFVAVLRLREGTSRITGIEAVRKPEGDRDDRKTGFKVTQREYNWSGFMGDAFVVTFDDAFPFQDRDAKFVFWTEMNYIPHWHLNNQLLYTYEFVETWDEDIPGCHEPMSDRVRQWTRVEVLEDNAVRKVLKWHYVLCNPNYHVPAEGGGEQLPEVDEIWTFYPDGRGTRHIRYTPKLDTDFRAAHELGELISIAGSTSHSSDFYAEPALTLMNLSGEVRQAHPGEKFNYYSEIDDWNEQILAVHLKDDPDVFCAWSHNPALPETYSGYPLRYENAWQNPKGKMVHWPVNKRPYTSPNGAGGTWKGEVSHACLLSYGIRDGIEWEDHYKVDERGRKYREWVSLIGLNATGDREGMLDKTRSWLYPGMIVEEGGIFVEKDYQKNGFTFEIQPDTRHMTIRFKPDKEDTKIVHPVFRLNGWGAGTAEDIKMDGMSLRKNQFRSAIVNDKDLLIWLDVELSLDSKVKVEK